VFGALLLITYVAVYTMTFFFENHTLKLDIYIQRLARLLILRLYLYATLAIL
jgi:hypothetical protein